MRLVASHSTHAATVAQAVPGVVTSANEIVKSTATISFLIHGGCTNEGAFSLTD
mgnify:CR=1 FL=1